MFGTLRWDVYDLGEEPYKRMGFEKVFEDSPGPDPKKVATFFGASDASHSAFIAAYIDPEAGATRMPPPPATPLTARDRAVLTRWSDMLKRQPPVPGPVLKGSHQPNHPPVIRWLQQPTLAVVRDEDGDQVLGKLDCNGGEVRIQYSGAVVFSETTKPPCRGTLYDGYEEATVSLE